jgi:hypothetical protein
VSLTSCSNDVHKLRQEVEDDQKARAKESRTNRTLLWVAAIGLLGTFLTSTAVVAAAVL